MTDNLLPLERLAEKNYRVAVPLWDADAWQEIRAAEPGIPASVAQLRRLVQIVYRSKGRQKLLPNLPSGVSRGVIHRRFEECGEVLRWHLLAGLGSPYLTQEQREAIEADMDADMPTFENSVETDHFILRWTNTSATASDNIADSSIVSETGGYLENAWASYNATFGGPPYLAPGSTKIDVVFYDIGGFGATTPTGPIELDAPNWISQPGIRRPTSAHELFHRVQYAFGYRTTWTPSGAYQWFSEGSASWGEVFVWQRVSMASKITNLFTNPDLNLYNASYSALPFWIFFQTRQQDVPGDNPMISFLQKYQLTGNEQNSMAQVIDEDWPPNNVYGQLDTFFALFGRDRRLGHWRITPSGPTPYPTILGPDGSTLEPMVALTDVSLGAGDSYATSGSVSALGSDYFRFALEPDSAGHVFAFSNVGSPGGNYSYYLIWEKAGAWQRASFPFGVSGAYSYSETVNLTLADGVVLVISGRGAGGAYALNASVS